MYLRYGRAIEAIQASLDRIVEVPTRLLFRILDGIIVEFNKNINLDNTMNSFYVERALSNLDCRNDVSLGENQRN